MPHIRAGIKRSTKLASSLQHLLHLPSLLEHYCLSASFSRRLSQDSPVVSTKSDARWTLSVIFARPSTSVSPEQYGWEVSTFVCGGCSRSWRQSWLFSTFLLSRIDVHEADTCLFSQGNIAALSLMVIPALSKRIDGVSRSTVVKQWRSIYELGKTQNPPIAAVTSAAFFYLAWSARCIAPQSRIPLCYGSAAILTLGIAPFTLLVMSTTNNKLIHHSEFAPKKSHSPSIDTSDEEIDRLLARWTSLNAFRSLLPLIGGLLGLAASLA